MAPLTAPLGGRSALVTGASRGIGRAIAESLAAAGARVALVARSERGLALAADHIASSGGEALVLPCDVRDDVQVDTTMRRVSETFGGAPDVLVNNAGHFALSLLHETDVAAFTRAVDENLIGAFRFLRACVGPMRARGTGHIITIGSAADDQAYPENAAYSASKFGLRGLHEVARVELRGTGVRATLVSPGPVDTHAWDAIDPDARPGFTPRAQMLRAEDVAAAVLYAVTAPSRVNVDLIRLNPA